MDITWTKTEQKIISLFNRTDLRPGEDVIDNTDVSISKELNLHKSYVWKTLNLYLKRKVELHNLNINS